MILSAEEVKIKELEDKLNESQIREKSKDDELNSVRSELEWLTGQYNTLMNATFNELFDLSYKVKEQSLFKLIERRNKIPEVIKEPSQNS